MSFSGGFQSELGKLAFDYGDARKIVGLARKAQSKDPFSPVRALAMGPHAAAGNKHLLSTLVETQRARLPKVIEAPLARLAKSLGITTESATKALTEQAAKKLDMPPQELAGAGKELRKVMEQSMVPMSGSPGSVSLPNRDYTSALLNRYVDQPQTMSTKEKAFLEGIIASHEMSERELTRGGAKAPFILAAGHADPGVILRESAAVASSPE